MKSKFLVMDVDGTLTDGKIYIDSNGELMKAFNIKDGYAIKNLLPIHNVIPVVITGRTSSITDYRMRELGVVEIHQNIQNKEELLKRLLQKYNCTTAEVAYIGDDLNDLSAMIMCAVKGCPQDASDAIKNISDYICKQKGGEGCVREFIEFLIARE
jgi:3-deoxy-D-manno-octulosonate 8-phosphate phosphatase (KDO 8-P phosphatase)